MNKFIDELEKSYNHTNQWLKFAESKNGALITLLSFIPVLSKNDQDGDLSEKIDQSKNILFFLKLKI